MYIYIYIYICILISCHTYFVGRGRVWGYTIDAQKKKKKSLLRPNMHDQHAAVPPVHAVHV